MNKSRSIFLVDRRFARILSLVCVLFLQSVTRVSGVTRVPALIPSPQKIVWNGQKFKIEKSHNWLIQRIVDRIPEIHANSEEGYTLKINADSAVLVATYFELAPVFGEHMVFQQSKPLAFFGRAGVNDQVQVLFAQHAGECFTGVDGNWKISLPMVPAGGPYPLKILVNGKTVTEWKDILVGEVWFCSGQSNMAFPLDQSADGLEEAELASGSQLRLMNYHPIASTQDETWDAAVLKKINRFNYFEGTWVKSSPAEAAGFSAIAWHFGKELREMLKVPVGLIQVAVGGAPAEAFIDRETVGDHPQLSNILADWFRNDLVMEWCRERALKNISLQNPYLQKHPFMPSYIFEAGISSFIDFPVKGVIWYQGESNAHNTEFYEVVFPALVSSWRQFWRNEELPFIYAQLSSIQRPGWEIFRDSQRKMALKIPNSGMVVTSDLGDSLNVHPIHKKEIGHRFALQALQKFYGKNLKADGPQPETARLKDGILEISFGKQQLSTCGSLPLRELEVAGKDGVFHPTEGQLKDNKIIVQTKNHDIKQVRYAWKPFSRGNLINREGLPASTFILSVN